MSMKQNKKLNVDKTRQAFHLTGQSGWINDPNGCVFYRGKYHVFFQFRESEQRKDG